MTNIEEILINYINTNTSYVCAAELSNPRVEDVTLEATGGTSDEHNIVKRGGFAIQTYGDSRAEAQTKALAICDVLRNLANDTEEISKVEIGVPYNWTDREPRYQIVVDIVYV